MHPTLALTALVLAGCAARNVPANQARQEGIVRVSDVQLVACEQARDGCVRVQCQLDNGNLLPVQGALDIGVNVGDSRLTDGPQPMRLTPGSSAVHSEEYSLIGQSLAVCGTREDIEGLDVQASIRSCDDDDIAHTDCVKVECEYTWSGAGNITFEAVTRLQMPRGAMYQVWDTDTTRLNEDKRTKVIDNRFIEPDEGRVSSEINQWEELSTDAEADNLYTIAPSCTWRETQSMP